MHTFLPGLRREEHFLISLRAGFRWGVLLYSCARGKGGWCYLNLNILPGSRRVQGSIGCVLHMWMSEIPWGVLNSTCLPYVTSASDAYNGLWHLAHMQMFEIRWIIVIRETLLDINLPEMDHPQLFSLHWLYGKPWGLTYSRHPTLPYLKPGEMDPHTQDPPLLLFKQWFYLPNKISLKMHSDSSEHDYISRFHCFVHQNPAISFCWSHETLCAFKTRHIQPLNNIS